MINQRAMNKREESLYQSGYDLGEARFKQKVREAIEKKLKHRAICDPDLCERCVILKELGL